jgi:hypothetical protein
MKTKRLASFRAERLYVFGLSFTAWTKFRSGNWYKSTRGKGQVP